MMKPSRLEALAIGMVIVATACSEGRVSENYPWMEVIDQEFVPTQLHDGLEITRNQSVAQTFTVGVTGMLTRVDLINFKVHAGTPTADVVVQIRRTDANLRPSGDPGDILATSVLTPAEIPASFFVTTSVDLGASGVRVTEGDVLAIVLTQPDLSDPSRYAWWGRTDVDGVDPYPGGQSHFSVSPQDFGPGRVELGFRTVVEDNTSDSTGLPVPEVVSYSFEGSVTSVAGTALPGEVASGDTVTGTFCFEGGVRDPNPSTVSGFYEQTSDKIYGAAIGTDTLTRGTFYRLQTTHTATLDRLEVLTFSPATTFDLPVGFRISSMKVDFRADDGGVFTNFDLPTTIDLSDWDTTELRLQVATAQNTIDGYLIANITSLTRNPTDGVTCATTACPVSGAPGSGDYCSEECPCGEGEGDCDGDGSLDCAPGLTCVHNVGANYGWDPNVDVCEATCHSSAPGTSSYCSAYCPCDEGEGDCDGDGSLECAPGLTCVHNVGANYGWDPDIDVCERVSWTAGVAR